MGCLRTEALSDLNPTGIYYGPTVFWGFINMGQVPPPDSSPRTPSPSHPPPSFFSAQSSSFQASPGPSQMLL